MESIEERAREVGRLLAQTDEYKTMRRANERLEANREILVLMNQLADLEDQMTASLRSGQHPANEVQEEYTRLAEDLQQRAEYQAVAAAQANFERLMGRINEEIARGIKAGEQSRIILP